MLSGSASAGDFYLRAGIGLDRPAGTTFTDRDCSSASPAALYGCGRGGDGAPYGSRGGFGTAPVLELGLGYAAAPAIRMEVLGEYRPRLAFEGRANFLEPGRRQSVAAELSSLSGMLAGYVDLPVTGAGEDRSFRAVRGGRGGRRAHADWRDADDVPEDDNRGSGRGSDRSRLDADGGVAVALGERATLDLAWRYTDLGEVRTGRSAGRVVWRDGSRGPLPLDLAETRARLGSHGLRLSLRYGF